MPEAGTPRIDPLRSRPDAAAADAARDTAPGDAHIDLVAEAIPGPKSGEPDRDPESENGAGGEVGTPLVWRPAPLEAATDTDGADRNPEVEAERDQWRERAIIWRERALAAEVVAKELGTHLADVRENLEDVRIAMRALTEQRSAIGASPGRPRTGWREYVARLLDLDR